MLNNLYIKENFQLTIFSCLSNKQYGILNNSSTYRIEFLLNKPSSSYYKKLDIDYLNLNM